MKNKEIGDARQMVHIVHTDQHLEDTTTGMLMRISGWELLMQLPTY